MPFVDCLKHGVTMGTNECPNCKDESESPASSCCTDATSDVDQRENLGRCTDDDFDYDDQFEDTPCHTCGGDGLVESVAAVTGRWGWDEDDVGRCPNCNGSGKAKDCWYW